MNARSRAGASRVRCGRRDRGSAALETVALLPLLIFVGSFFLQLGVAVWTTAAADTAARSAARALSLTQGSLERGGPLIRARKAANDSLPGSLSAENVTADPLPGADGVKVTVWVEIPRVSVLPLSTVQREAVMPRVQ